MYASRNPPPPPPSSSSIPDDDTNTQGRATRRGWSAGRVGKRGWRCMWALNVSAGGAHHANSTLNTRPRLSVTIVLFSPGSSYFSPRRTFFSFFSPPPLFLLHLCRAIFFIYLLLLLLLLTIIEITTWTSFLWYFSD